MCVRVRQRTWVICVTLERGLKSPRSSDMVLVVRGTQAWLLGTNDDMLGLQCRHSSADNSVVTAVQTPVQTAVQLQQCKHSSADTNADSSADTVVQTAVQTSV